MNATELRTGNYIYYKSGRIEVTMIGENGIQSHKKGIEINAKFNTTDLQPIPLTEDWLLNFGFEDKMGEWHNKICLEKSNNEIYYSAGMGVRLSETIKYVHQLQNLFFALSGEELTINQKLTNHSKQL